tara:strand:- start:14580 stop:14945 length:366 start_codon:yes stop_codon:yes gene_type:complete
MNVGVIWIELDQKVKKLKNELAHYESESGWFKTMFSMGVIHYGQRLSPDSESGTDWYIVSGKKSEDEIYQIKMKLGIAKDTDRGIWDDNDWDCSGKLLKSEPIVKKSKTRYLIKQSWSYDF